jgi:hypothetical protein
MIARVCGDQAVAAEKGRSLSEVARTDMAKADENGVARRITK